MSKSSPRGADWRPSGNVRHAPVPWRLMPVEDWHGREVVSKDGPAFWIGVPFDPWQRGDLVVTCTKHSIWTQGKGHSFYESWAVGRRASVPSAAVARVQYGEGSPAYRLERGTKLFRIPYHWRSAAAQLVGQSFESQEALESAMERAQRGQSIGCIQQQESAPCPAT